MIKTRFTTNEQSSILNEFFQEFSGVTVKGVHLTVFRRKLILAVEKIIENEGVIYSEGDKGLRTHFFTCILLKLLRKMKMPAGLKLNRNFKRYMREKVFRKVFLCALSILFSQDHCEIGSMLGISCCMNRFHYGLCRMKWAELNNFAQVGFLKMMNLKFTSSLKGEMAPIEVEIESLLSN